MKRARSALRMARFMVTALDGDKPVGYLLAFQDGRDVYCTTLAVIPEYQRTRAVVSITRALCRAMAHTPCGSAMC